MKFFSIFKQYDVAPKEVTTSSDTLLASVREMGKIQMKYLQKRLKKDIAVR